MSPTRSEGIFLARNDMDLSRFFFALSQTEFPLLEFLKDWKAKYNFVGSYYINNGNNPTTGEFTDWSVSKPLYDQYIALGNEIGTHSYTHPQRTSDLDANTLRFEFEQSKIEIEAGLGNTVLGTAIPGEDENLFVVDELKKYLDYISGHGFYSSSDRHFNPSIGFLTPDDNLLYYSLNMTPDYVLGDVMKLTPEQSIQFWKDEMASAALGMPKGVIQFLWHDYAVTTALASGNYSVAMIEETLKNAYQKGYEFVSLQDFMNRYRAARSNSLNYFWNDTDTLTVQVTGGGLGQYAMEFANNLSIGSVKDWFAYNNNTIFVPENGGIFEVNFSSEPQSLTRISSLPMRMKLRSTSGDGSNLTFDVYGEGKVEISLNTSNNKKYQVMGVRDFEYVHSDLISIDLPTIGEYRIQILETDNILPITQNVSIAGDWNMSHDFQVSTIDFDGTVESVQITRAPLNGTVNFNGFVGTFTPNSGFSGADSFEFIVIDNLGAQSLPATGTINISQTNSSDGLANYNFLNREFILNGQFDEWEGLESALVDAADATQPLDQLDYREIALAHDDTHFYIRYSSEKAAALNWAHNIYIDTDANPGTGYQYWYVGGDILIQAGKAYKYLGTGADWNWQSLTDSQIATDPAMKQFELSLNRSVIAGSQYIKLVFLADNFAYPGGSTFDFAPDGFTTTGATLDYYFINPNSNFAPVATPDSAVLLKNTSRQFTLDGVDRESSNLTYQISAQPLHGTLEGLPPNVTYTPSPDYLGVDTFTFRVSDGDLVSQAATITIRVIDLPPGNVFSNNGSSVFLDGNLDDWSNLVPLPSDSPEILEQAAGIDWKTAYLANDDSSLFVAIQSGKPISLNWGYMVFIDTDLNASTGFQLSAVPGLGCEYMVQGSALFRYTGTGLDWAWQFVNFNDRGTKDHVFEFRIALSDMGILNLPVQVKMVFYGDNSAFSGGTTLDLYPDAGSSFSPGWTYEIRTPSLQQNVADQPVRIAPAYNHTLRIYERTPMALTSSGVPDDDTLLFKLRFEANPRSTWNLEKSLNLNDWLPINRWTVYGAESNIILTPEHFQSSNGAFFLRGKQSPPIGSTNH